MKQRTRKRVAKKKTTRKRTRVVLRKRTRITRKRTPPKRKAPPKKRRRRRTPPPAPVEYSVNVSYRRSARPQNAISFQMSVFGPPNASKDEVIDVVTETIESEGEDVRRGWKVKIVSWKGGSVPRKVPWSALAIIAGEPASRFSVQ